MKAILLTAAALFSFNSAVAFGDDEVTCAYVVSLPGIDVKYFASTDTSESSAKWMAEKTCEYNNGKPFGPEVCEQITCD